MSVIERAKMFGSGARRFFIQMRSVILHLESFGNGELSITLKNSNDTREKVKLSSVLIFNLN